METQFLETFPLIELVVLQFLPIDCASSCSGRTLVESEVHLKATPFNVIPQGEAESH